MARVTVVPDRFTMVHFDAARLADVAGEVAALVGVPGDRALRIEVD